MKSRVPTPKYIKRNTKLGGTERKAGKTFADNGEHLKIKAYFNPRGISA